MTKTQNDSKSVSMEDLLASTGYKIKSFTKGQKINAKFLRMSARTAVFDIGGKSEGLVREGNFLEAKNLIENLKAGDEIAAMVMEPESRDGATLLSLRGAAQDDFWKKIKKAQEEGKVIEVIVKSVNPHGLVAALENETAFIPNSQLGAVLTKMGEGAVGKHVKTKIIDLDEGNLRIVLSEKAVSEADSLKDVDKALKSVSVGNKFKGVVTTVTNFGAFVQITVPMDDKKVEVEGLVHVSELSWAKTARAEDVIAVGDKVDVKVIGVEHNKLSFSMKQAGADPWETATEKYHPDDKITGTIVRVSDFGAFVEVAPGVEGLIHITKIPPATALKEGQKVNCYIEEVDKKEKRLSLGLLVTSAKPVGYK